MLKPDQASPRGAAPKKGCEPEDGRLIKQEINSVQAIKGKVDQGAIW